MLDQNFIIMKTTILSISFLLCLSFQANSQGLIVTYEETRAARTLNLSQIDDPHLRVAVERQLREQTNSPRVFQLFVNNGVSVYKAGERNRETNTSISSGNTTGSITTQRMGIQTVYKNHHDKLMLATANLGREEYLVEEPQAALEWNIGSERKEISGFQCMKATTRTVHGQLVTAWFTPDVPISEGPSFYWGLPGLILYVDVNNGQLVFAATVVEQTNDVPAIHIPDKGERISRAEFNRLQQEHAQGLQNDDRNRVGIGDNTRSIRIQGSCSSH